MSGKPHWHKLYASYLAGDLTEDSARTLRTMLEKDAAIRRETRDDMDMRGLLGQMSAEKDGPIFCRALMERIHAAGNGVEFVDSVRKKRLSIRQPGGKRRAHLISWAPPAAAVGIAAAIVAVWLMGRGEEVRGKRQVIASVSEVRGEVTADYTNYADKKMVKVGDEIRVGDKITVGEGGRVSLAYVGEETWVDLTSNAECRMSKRSGDPDGSGPNAEFLELRKGSLTAHVEKRSALPAPSSAFAVLTPHARVAVLGTRFSVRVEEGEQSQIANQKSQIPSTWLQVEEGLVRFTRLADGKAIDVAAGQFAVAGASASGGYALKAYAAGMQWVDGPVIFQDDFSGDLSQWDIVARSGPDEKFVAAIDTERDTVRIEEVTRDGATTRTLVVNILRKQKIVLGIRPRSATIRSPYALEWDSCHDSVGASSSPVCPGVTNHRSLYDDPDSRRVRARRWLRRRLECVPARDAEWEDAHELRVYFSGNLTTRRLVQFDNRSFILEVSGGKVMMDNIVVRALEPAEQGARDDVSRAKAVKTELKRQD